MSGAIGFSSIKLFCDTTETLPRFAWPSKVGLTGIYTVRAAREPHARPPLRGTRRGGQGGA